MEVVSSQESTVRAVLLICPEVEGDCFSTSRWDEGPAKSTTHGLTGSVRGSAEPSSHVSADDNFSFGTRVDESTE
eukprot:2410560-Rhodomonas_salina.1